MYSTQYDYRSAMLAMFVNRLRKMVSFELDKEIEKDFSEILFITNRNILNNFYNTCTPYN